MREKVECAGGLASKSGHYCAYRQCAAEAEYVMTVVGNTMLAMAPDPSENSRHGARIIKVDETEIATGFACDDDKKLGDACRTVRSGHVYRLAGLENEEGRARAGAVHAEAEDDIKGCLADKRAYFVAKRAFDVVFSLLVLVCFSWLFALVALAVKLDDPKGPVFFSQERVGKGGKAFRMHKFRSMCADAEERLAELKELNEKTGPVFKIADDPRVTRVGRVIRKLSLDELPQFVNVLRGDIPSRILKTRQGFSLKKPGAFALPAKLARTRIAASLQVRAFICAIAGVPQNLFEYFIAGYGEMREVFAKRGSRIDFPPSWPL